MDKRYAGWTRHSNGVEYLVSPEEDRVAYDLRGRVVEFTWNRHIGGGVGPKEHEDIDDYVRRKTNGSLHKRDLRSLVAVLEGLESRFGRKK